MDDPFADRIRAARPVSGNRNLPLTDRAKRELAELLISAVPTSPPARSTRPHRPDPRLARVRHRWSLPRLAVAAAATVVAAIGIVPILTPAPVHAATPHPLTVTPIDTPAPELLETMSDHAAQRSDPPGPTEIRVQSWNLSVTDDDSNLATVIAPEDYRITIAVDGARTVEVRAGHPVTPDGTPTTDPDTGVTPGGLLWSQTDAPGDYEFVFTGPIPTDPGAMGDFLGQGTTYGTTPDGADYIQAIASLLFEREPTGAQEAAILTFLAQQPDIHTAGTVTDRLGRDGIAFRATRSGDPDYADYLVISPATGQVLAVETLYTGTTRTDIPHPAVTSYLTWNRTSSP
ncbi:hypothetical protein Xcel_0862 [Xylanimonas cellulosilytica DSM 15894]|uniref:Uncharacterized protein n=1 Tax=Xylanimonas cellulosilytica (strain DSM 15894 / JCM 12276 / CECT 5975 / KCTC 9989 / LMG 20990 / NBRC 107835 / XIL07) TaxID=446471 RepID=D1BY51_XYLCX|nr:CU044_5270 family protein [Xylanimonas cellulosilytica]ACZ29894.1 hypothetical protein Xcel_0862 [Xylanimonas cellulosilytica DSM 15894]